MEIEANGAQDAKNISEQAAAIRSLKTNLCLAILFAIPLILLIKFKADIQMTFSLSLLFSIQKVVVTIFATIANFGTVRQVMKNYYEKLCR